MNNRRIQVAAAAVIFNAAMVLGFTSPVALADACTAANGTYCDYFNYCPSNSAAACAAFAPAGCKVSSSACFPIFLKCTTGQLEVGCNFTAS
ncbi:MAG: hypothetical protein OSA97_12505 [Nevskia sp.]|nr:hypothetical protein [Nevskia sp.]